MSSKGGTGKKSSKALAQATNEIAAQTAPARKEYFRDVENALMGRADQIPAAKTAYRNTLAASEAGATQLGKSYARAGIESRFADPGVDQARMEGARSAEDARQAVLNAFLGEAPSAIFGTTSQGQAGLLSSAQRGFGIAAAQQQQTTQLAGAGAAAAASILAAFL